MHNSCLFSAVPVSLWETAAGAGTGGSTTWPLVSWSQKVSMFAGWSDASGRSSLSTCLLLSEQQKQPRGKRLAGQFPSHWRGQTDFKTRSQISVKGTQMRRRRPLVHHVPNNTLVTEPAGGCSCWLVTRDMVLMGHTQAMHGMVSSRKRWLTLSNASFDITAQHAFCKSANKRRIGAFKTNFC